MEDKLVTLAILTYTKAQILKNVLENEGIETYIHNVNQIQPVVSSGVRLRIKESDLPRALKITESSTWLSESIVGEKEPKTENKSNKILIPVDFSNYSMKACEFAFNLAKTENAEVILLHVYFTPIYASSLPYGDVFKNTPFKQFSEVKRIAFITNFDQRDLIAFEAFFNTWKSFHFSVSLIHLTDSKDTWNEIKLAGIKEYFHKQYPGLEIHYDVVMNDNLLKGLDQYIKDNQIDIITLTSYKRNIFARLFNPSIARKMIFHSDTPLLVINS